MELTVDCRFLIIDNQQYMYYKTYLVQNKCFNKIGREKLEPRKSFRKMSSFQVSDVPHDTFLEANEIRKNKKLEKWVCENSRPRNKVEEDVKKRMPLRHLSVFCTNF